MNKQIAEYENIDAMAKIIVETVKPQKVYLFGSFARGEQNAESDYDFCAIVDDDVQHPMLLAGYAYSALGTNRDREVDIVVMRSKTFNERKTWPASLENQIYNEGVLLYE